jgi:hypothetical protein
VIGDDVAIWDDDLARLYREEMNLLGVPISETKSITSDKLAEFAKRVITPNEVVLPHKWSEIADPAVHSYLQKVGQEGIPTLTGRQRRLVTPFLELPEPFGFGWNPKGKPLHQRMSFAMAEGILKGTLGLEVPGDGISPSTEFRHADIPLLGLSPRNTFSVQPRSRTPLLDQSNESLMILMALERSGLPVAENMAQIIFDDLLSLKRRKYPFRDPRTRKVLAHFQSLVMSLRRDPKTRVNLVDIWPRYSFLKKELVTIGNETSLIESD